MSSSNKDVETQLNPSELKPESDLDDHNPSGHSRDFYFAYGALLLSVFIGTLDIVIVASALPAISRDLGASSSDAYWVGTTYLLAQTVAQPISGSLSDIFGRKILLQASLVIFLVTSIVCARAQTIRWLIGARVAQGIGGGGLLCLPSIIVSDMTTLRERPKFISSLSIPYAIGNFGIIIGAAVGERATWRWIFYINIPLSLIGIVAVQLFLHLSREKKSSKESFLAVDWLGITVFAGSVTSFLVGVSSGGVSHPWDSASIVAPIVIGLCGLGAFALVEIYVSPVPMVSLEVFGTLTGNIAMFQSFILGFVQVATAFELILYFVGAKGFSMIRAGCCLLAILAVLPVASVISGILTLKSGDLRVSLWAGFILWAAGTGSFLSFTSSTSVAQFEGLQVLFGWGLGLVYPSITVLGQVGQPDELHTVAINLVYFFRTLGGALGVAIGGTIFQNRWQTLVDRRIANGDISPTNAIRGQDAEAAFDSISGFPANVARTYRLIYGQSLKPVWYTCMALVLVGLATTLVIRPTNLNKGYTSNQRLKEKPAKTAESSPEENMPDTATEA